MSRRVWSCHAQDRLASIRKLKEHVYKFMTPEEIIRRLWEGGFFYTEKPNSDVNWGYKEGTSIRDYDPELEAAVLRFRPK